MMRLSFWNLRTLLILLVLLAVTPALGLILFTASEQRQLAAVQVQENALRLAHLASINQERYIEGARQLLTVLAQLPEVRSGNSVACTAFFANLLKQYPLYANFGVIEPKGNIFCSALPFSSSVNAADRSYFKRALATRDFAMGDYQVGRITQKATVNFGYPVFDDVGHVQAVVFSALDLAWLNQLAANAKLPPGSTLTLIDRNGTILVRYPDPEQWVGQSNSEMPIVKTILTQGEGVAEGTGLDGIPRLYAFTPLHGIPEAGYVYVSIGIPKQAAFAQADRILIRNLTGLGLAGLLALVAAWVGGDLFILRRVNTLVNVTKRLSTGDLNVRTGLSYQQGELGQLAQAFDEMAKSLEAKTASIEYQAAHDRLTGLPNRFLLQDRLQQAILTAQRENKPVAILMMDLNRFKEINNTLGHRNGDLLLQQIGPRISGVLRDSDTLARLEGDKFAALLPPDWLELEITESTIMADPARAMEILTNLHKSKNAGIN